MGFFGKDDKEKQLKQEVKSLELRREAAFAAINGEIGRLQNERSNVLLQAGTAAYDVWCKDSKQADLTQFWTKIGELEKSIAEQEAKKTEMGAKYDEEIKLINTNLGIGVGGGGADSGARCPKCGAAINQGDSFCQSCGASIQ